MDNNLVHIKTATGLEIDVDPNACNDMELLDACYEVQENSNLLALPVVLKHLLTDPARKALYEHIRKTHGRVRTEPLMEELIDIMEQMGSARQDGTAAEPAPAPEPEALFPGDAAPDRTKQPPSCLVDTIMARLHGALPSNPAQADKLEKATRAALDVASVESAWRLLDNITGEIEAAQAARMVHEAISDLAGDPPAPRPAEPVPCGAAAVNADFVRAGTTPAPHDAAAQASAAFTPRYYLKAEEDSTDVASSAAE